MRPALELLSESRTNLFHFNGEYLVVQKLAAAPIDLLVVFSLRRDGVRNEPRSFARPLEPTVGKDYLIVLPSSISFQFVRKI
jgi:hypothetical protein